MRQPGQSKKTICRKNFHTNIRARFSTFVGSEKTAKIYAPWKVELWTVVFWTVVFWTVDQCRLALNSCTLTYLAADTASITGAKCCTMDITLTAVSSRNITKSSSVRCWKWTVFWKGELGIIHIIRSKIGLLYSFGGQENSYRHCWFKTFS